jgi:hypothetical protein
MKFLKGILLPALLALATTAAAAKKDKPLVEVTTFETEHINLFYFDDSEVTLSTELETGIVWRSENAGKSWKKLDFRTLMVVKNPYDNKVAVALGDVTHRITYDQGESWSEFETDWPPSWTTMPIGWHAQDNKKILYHTIEDIMTGIGRVCDNIVEFVCRANCAHSHTIPKMASSQNRNSSAPTARCARGRRALNDSSQTPRSTTAESFVS